MIQKWELFSISGLRLVALRSLEDCANHLPRWGAPSAARIVPTSCILLWISADLACSMNDQLSSR
jgi:hypothetical protein